MLREQEQRQRASLLSLCTWGWQSAPHSLRQWKLAAHCIAGFFQSKSSSSLIITSKQKAWTLTTEMTSLYIHINEIAITIRIVFSDQIPSLPWFGAAFALLLAFLRRHKPPGWPDQIWASKHNNFAFQETTRHNWTRDSKLARVYSGQHIVWASVSESRKPVHQPQLFPCFPGNVRVLLRRKGLNKFSGQVMWHFTQLSRNLLGQVSFWWHVYVLPYHATCNILQRIPIHSPESIQSPRSALHLAAKRFPKIFAKTARPPASRTPDIIEQVTNAFVSPKPRITCCCYCMYLEHKYKHYVDLDVT